MSRSPIIEGVIAPLALADVNTDAILPSCEIQNPGRTGFAEGLFAGWRYLSGTRLPDSHFVLNQPRYHGATLLLGGANFGCGSSRESAVWALRDFGIRCILAPSFGHTFYRNCIYNGLLPARGELKALENLLEVVVAGDRPPWVLVDVADCSLRGPGTHRASIEVPEVYRTMWLQQWEPLDLARRFLDDIARFEAKDEQLHPWKYRRGGR